MKLYLVPFRQEAKLLTSILPNCRSLLSENFSGCWEFNGGRVVCWNQAGTNGIIEIIKKIPDLDSFSEVILFGSAGSLAKNLSMGAVYSCTNIKDTKGNSWKIEGVDGFTECSLLTTETLIFDNDLRYELWQKYECELVDMEASAFAELAVKGFFGKAKAGVVRFVSDTYEILPELDPVTKNFTGKFPAEIRQQIAKHRKSFL